MKYLKRFNTENGYESYISDDPFLPNVSYSVETDNVYFNRTSKAKTEIVYYTRNHEISENINFEAFDCPLISNEYDEENLCCVLTFGGRLTKIPESAFTGNQDIERIVLPSSITEIGNNAFANTSMYECNIDGITKIGDKAFFESGLYDVWFGPNNKEIGAYAFAKSQGLNVNNLTGSSVEIIGEGAFSGCVNASFDSRLLPNTVKEIGDFAFLGCENLHSVYIPSSATYLGKEAFTMCAGLYCVDFSLGCPITGIGYATFLSCTALTSVTYSSTMKSIGEYAFDCCYNLCSIDLSSIDMMDRHSFYYCHSLSDVTLSDNLLIIPEDCFNGCTNLSAITIPDSVFRICGGAFYNTTIRNITIPAGVTFIGGDAFTGEVSIDSLVSYPIEPPELHCYFNFADASIKIQVPSESVEAYKQAPTWDYFADRIVAMP